VAHLQANDPQPGEKELELALKLDPALWQACLALAECKLNAGDAREAIVFARQALDLIPKLVSASNARQRTGEPYGLQQGAVETRTISEEHPAMPSGTIALAGCTWHRVSGSRPKRNSRLHCRPIRAISIPCQPWPAPTCSRQSEKAIQRITQAIERNPDQARLYEILGQTRLAMKDLPKAEEAYLKALAANPESANQQQVLADFYATTGRPEKSIEVMIALLKKEPRNSWARDRLPTCI